MAKTDTILITGGTGFAGSHLVELLLQDGYSNVHVTAFNSQASYVGSLLPTENIHQVNLMDAEATSALVQQLQPNHLYHLAAMAEVGGSFAAAEKTLVNNSVLQLHMLEAVRSHAPQARVLVIGSGQEYDLVKLPQTTPPTPVGESQPLGPTSPYALSKVTQDLLGLSYFYAYKLNIIRCRPFNHIGERQPTGFAIPDFAKQIAEAEKGGPTELKVGNLAAIRDFTDVKDVVKAYQILIEHGEVGEVYNIGSGQGHSIHEMLDILLKLSSASITITQDPAKMRPLDVPAIIADNAKMKQLGWQPSVPIQDTLARVLAYWRTQV